MDRHNVKVSIQPWDSDKDPNGYWEWMRSISSLVRSCDGGHELQNFTDEKLGLPVVKSHVVPTCIANDPDFDSDDEGDSQRQSVKFRSPGLEAAKSMKESAKAEDSSDVSPVSIRTPGSRHGSSREESYFEASTSYKNLSRQALVLDSHMFSIMSMNLKGSKHALLRHVKRSSYVQACIVLSKHFDIVRNNRKSEALEQMETLALKGSVQQWAIDVVKAYQELIESGVTVQDFKEITKRAGWATGVARMTWGRQRSTSDELCTFVHSRFKCIVRTDVVNKQI